MAQSDRYWIVDNADGWSVYVIGRLDPVGVFLKGEWTRKQIEKICELLNR